MQKVVIIGSGPAGLTAAIYCARAGLEPVVISGPQPGGQLTTTSKVENFPGFPGGVDGFELMQNMRAQAEELGVRFHEQTVEKVERASDGMNRRGTDFNVHLDSGETLVTRSVIVATGAKALTLDLPNTHQLMGRGVSTCAVCDGFFYKGKTVAVVGGGDSAMEDALYLAELAREVLVIVRRSTLRASKVLQDRALSHPKIQFFWCCEVASATTDVDGLLNGVILESTLRKGRARLPVDGLFMAIGHTPNTGFLNGLVELHPEGYIQTRHGTYTSEPGIFAAGDVADPDFRQAITAASFGCQAARQAEQFLNGAGRWPW